MPGYRFGIAAAYAAAPRPTIAVIQFGVECNAMSRRWRTLFISAIRFEFSAVAF
jgi:hypothetical protein